MNDRLIIGMDFNENETDLSRFDVGVKEPVPVIASFGGGRETFPTVLAVLPSSGVWKFGYEAENLIEKKEAISVPFFFRKCVRGEEFRENGKTFTAATILAEYIRLSLTQVGVEDPATQVRSFVLTVPNTGRAIAQTAENAFDILGIGDGRASIIDHAESFFYHTFRSSSVYKREAALYHFPDRSGVEYISIGSDSTMIPYTVSVHDARRTELPKEETEKDAAFCDFVNETINRTDCPSVFLVGRWFERSWAKQSLKALCKGARKVYHGSTLFSRGACYAAMERCGLLKSTDIRFIAEDLVTESIGMECRDEGERVFVPITSAGIRWYKSDNEIEFLMDGGRELELKAVDIRDSSVKRIRMQLDGLPSRPPRTTRIRLRIRYIEPGKCIIAAEDLGFGELFPATHKVWEEVLE